MTDNTEALPPLPEKRWAGFCGKCNSVTKFQERPNTKAAPCGRCGYATFCEELDYSDDEMRDYARAALAQRQQVLAEATDAMVEAAEDVDDLYKLGTPNTWRKVWRAMLAAAPALTAAPSAQAEPVRRLHSFSSIDCEKLIAATVPGGSVCDPQEVADSIRRYLNAWPSAQAEPQEPLTDEQIVMDGLMMTPTKTLESCAEAFTAGVRFAERAHGIGKQEPLQRPALVTALRGLLASLSRAPTEFELRAAAHEFTLMADRAAVAARAGGDDA